MVIDGVMWYSEIDALELRLRMLDPFVDVFVVVESDLTHSGLFKTWRLGEHRDRLAPWWDDIVWVKHQQRPHPNAWVLERDQRHAIKHAVSGLAGADDVVVFSDVDEIWSPSCLKVWQERIAAASMDFRLFSVYWQWPARWRGSIGGPWSVMEHKDWNGLRDIRASMPSVKGGWHFSWMGGTEQQVAKRDSFAHREFADIDVVPFAAQGRWFDGTDLIETAEGLPDEVFIGMPPAWYRTRSGTMPPAGG
jgi:beta-1,4-mannosyl-glycoprotein beta-1,4-N-acetylglucosaminyltransferase